MLYSGNLIKRFINVSDDLENMVKKLTVKTFEIEEVHNRVIPNDVVIGKSIKVFKHPDADKLNVCQIDCGVKGTYQILTGGENIVEGVFVPVALPGCYLPKIDLKIVPREMRGMDSNGMICSKDELGINEDSDKHWIWILDEDFDDLNDSDIGVGLGEKYGWLNNFIIDVDNKTLTNRPDLTGHFGVAVEINSIYSYIDPSAIKFNNVTNIFKTFRDTDILQMLDSSTRSGLKVQSQSDLLNMYIAIELKGVSVNRSKFFTRTILNDLGSAPRNNFVDFSNIFMNITGQPVHFFDADKLNGDIIVRQAKDGEEFIDLFGKKHELLSTDLVIADKDKILALAGIVGSNSSGIDENTKNIVIEIANFDAVQLRKTATRLGLRTDAEMRYEKNISPVYSLYALILMLDEIKYFAKDLGNFELGGLDVYIKPSLKSSMQKTIQIDLNRICKFIFGENLDGFDQKSLTILEGLGFQYVEGKLIVPIWRGPGDMNIKEDVCEEVARIYGFENIPMKDVMDMSIDKPYTLDVMFNRGLEELFVSDLGFDQIETYPMVHKDILGVFNVDYSKLFSFINPITPETAMFRDSMVYNLLESLEKNFRFFDEIKFFDIGKIWSLDGFKGGENIQITDYMSQRFSYEKTCLGAMIYNKSVDSWENDQVLYLKGIVNEVLLKFGLTGNIEIAKTDKQNYHPKKNGNIIYDGVNIGFIGQINPIIYDFFKFPENCNISFLQLDISTLKGIYSNIKRSINLANYETLSDNIIFRDLSFVLPKSQDFGALLDAVNSVSEIVDVEVFDIYQGSNIPVDHKSISIKIKIPSNANVKTEEINAIMDKAIQSIEKTGAKLRA